MSNYSNLSVISVITSVDCLYFIQIVAFLALGTISGFRLKPGHFRHYVLRLWILFKPSSLSSFLWHYSVQQGKGERHYFISLLTGRDRNLVSPLNIHKYCGRLGGGRKWLLTLQLHAWPSLTPLCRLLAHYTVTSVKHWVLHLAFACAGVYVVFCSWSRVVIV